MPVVNTINSLITELGNLMSLLDDATNDVATARSFLNVLGWELPPGLDDIGLTTIDLANTLDKLLIVLESTEAELEDEVLMASRIGELALAMGELINQIHHFAEELPNTTLSGFEDYVSRTNIHLELPRRILDILVVGYLIHKSPLCFSILNLLNIIEYKLFEADEVNYQLEHIRTIVHYGNVNALFSDPSQHFQDTYGWGTSQFEALTLLTRIAEVLQAIGSSVRLRPMDPRAEEALTGLPVPAMDVDPQPQMIISLYEELGEIAGQMLGFSVFGVRPTAEGAEDGGIGFLPIIKGQLQTSIPFYSFKETFFDLSAKGELLRQVALILRPNQPLEVLTAKNLSDSITGRFALSLRYGHPTSEKKTLFSFPGGSNLKIQQFLLTGGMEKYSSRPAESFMELALLGGHFTFSLKQADSFLQKSIPQKNVEAIFDFRLGWTKNKGIYFHGGGGLIVTIPLHIDLGPFHLGNLHLAMQTQEEGLNIEASTSGRLNLGPLTATVSRIGMEFEVSFTGGNLGLFGLSPHFKPPGGIGLVVDGGGFRGGGQLNFEPEQKRYTGFLELEYQDKISLKAIGLLTTQLPNGQEGYSLLIVITSKFTPIQLGFGFTLNGVGGLLGLNRTAKIERLRTGVKNNTLSSILFPTDIVANANRIISDLRQVFPPQENRFIFGPMAKIGWGSPPIITIDLGLMIEVPDPVRLAILGVVRAILPDEKTALLRLQVNFLGVIDFEKKQLSFDASLYDSKLLAYTLSGDMSIRLNWGNDPNFLLTVGGVHPACEERLLMNLPAIRRLTLQLLKGNNPRLTLETYFAVTSNTVQFGAKLELYAGAGSFNVYGFLAFDALFQFNPFYFIAQIGAVLALRRGRSSIASIKLDLTLEGTTPWKARGTAKLKLFWFLTVRVRFSKTFGEERNITFPDIKVIPLLEAALSATGNWQARIPARSHLLVSLKQLEATGDAIITHPFGILEVSQKVVPLNLRIDKFGNQKPSDGNTFQIQNVKVGAESQDTAATEEFFAPAHFFEKTDSEKISGKSFEKYDSGIKIISSEKLIADYYARRDVEHELFYIDSQRDQLLALWPVFLAPDAVAFNSWAVQGAISSSDLSFSKNRKSALAPDEVTVGQENFAVVNTSDLTVFDDGSLLNSEASALNKMAELIEENPALEGNIQVVPQFEVNEL